MTGLVPAHGSSISQASTRSPIATQPQPPCFLADFTDLPEQGQWFRMTLDGTEVTSNLTWVIAASPDSDTPPRACYATESGLAPGVHTLTVVVREPFDVNAEAVQSVNWSFEVTP